MSQWIQSLSFFEGSATFEIGEEQVSLEYINYNLNISTIYNENQCIELNVTSDINLNKKFLLVEMK